MSTVSFPALAKTLSDLNAALAAHPAARLTFVADDLRMDGSYHVTEIKSGTFVSLDCGGNPDTWTETVLQVEMSGDADSQNTMTSCEAGRHIWGKWLQKVGIAPDSRLTIEAGTAGQIPCAFMMSESSGIRGMVLSLGFIARSALCKPRHREIMQNVPPRHAALRAAAADPIGLLSAINVHKGRGLLCRVTREPPRLQPIWLLGLTQIIGFGAVYYCFAILAKSISTDFGWSHAQFFGCISLGLAAGGLGDAVSLARPLTDLVLRD